MLCNEFEIGYAADATYPIRTYDIRIKSFNYLNE